MFYGIGCISWHHAKYLLIHNMHKETAVTKVNLTILCQYLRFKCFSKSKKKGITRFVTSVCEILCL